ncbi:MAG: D-alanine--D-alanine ligase [Ruminiclostridium sp.]|nr:D-alanine--D-alanine ligase [Ruminiclostridium sp.]
MAKIRVAVLFGGATKDHKLSLQSAFSVLNGLSKEKYDITPVGITKKGRWLYFPGDYDEIRSGTWENNSDCCSAIISPDPIHAGIITIMSDGDTAIKRVDVILSALHGKYGEGGRIQSLLKLSRIPYTDCNPDTASRCMDKLMTHSLLNEAGISVPAYTCLSRSEINKIDEQISEIEKKFSYPVYVSASSCSSSIGANVAHNAEELKTAAKIAFSHHHTAIVEEFLSGRSLFCIVTGSSYNIEVSSIGETVKTKCESKYAGYTAEFVPHASLTPDEEKRVREVALKAYKALNFKGFAKMCICLKDGQVLLRRINAIPGFSPESSMPMLMAESGYTYGEMLDKLITQAIEG